MCTLKITTKLCFCKINENRVCFLPSHSPSTSFWNASQKWTETQRILATQTWNMSLESSTFKWSHIENKYSLFMKSMWNQGMVQSSLSDVIIFNVATPLCYKSYSYSNLITMINKTSRFIRFLCFSSSFYMKFCWCKCMYLSWFCNIK